MQFRGWVYLVATFISVESDSTFTLGAGDSEGDDISFCAMSMESAGLAKL